MAQMIAEMLQMSRTVVSIFDALQQNRGQVAQAHFEIWSIEVGTGEK